jgi:hypothetical protein
MERVKIHPHGALALQALTWIVYALRHLQFKEIQHAIAIEDLEPDDRSVSEDRLTQLV